MPPSDKSARRSSSATLAAAASLVSAFSAVGTLILSVHLSFAVDQQAKIIEAELGQAELQKTRGRPVEYSVILSNARRRGKFGDGNQYYYDVDVEAIVSNPGDYAIHVAEERLEFYSAAGAVEKRQGPKEGRTEWSEHPVYIALAQDEDYDTPGCSSDEECSAINGSIGRIEPRSTPHDWNDTYTILVPKQGQIKLNVCWTFDLYPDENGWEPDTRCRQAWMTVP